MLSFLPQRRKKGKYREGTEYSNRINNLCDLCGKKTSVISVVKNLCGKKTSKPRIHPRIILRCDFLQFLFNIIFDFQSVNKLVHGFLIDFITACKIF